MRRRVSDDLGADRRYPHRRRDRHRQQFMDQRTAALMASVIVPMGELLLMFLGGALLWHGPWRAKIKRASSSCF